MSRIPPRPIPEYPWYIRWFLRRQRRKYGAVLTPSFLWGRLPGAFLGMLALLAAFDRRTYPISRTLRSLVSIRVAQLNGCAFCVDLNAYHYMQARGTAKKAEEVGDWRQSEGFTEHERAALDYAERVTASCNAITDADIESLRAYFTEDEITALTAWIGFQNMSAKFNSALGAEEHGFCEAPAPPADISGAGGSAND